MTAGLQHETPRQLSVVPLEDVLAYRNDLVIYRFTNKFNIAKEEAEAIFLEMLRWLWYLASTEPTAENPEAHAIDDPILIIDEMWHEFILVTRDYTDFCGKMFGRYIHHVPRSEDEDSYDPQAAADVKGALASLLGRKREKYKGICEWLGIDVFKTWYQQFPLKYDSDTISRLRKA